MAEAANATRAAAVPATPYAVDLHAHSTCSDGALSPGDVVRLAATAGVRTFALTDHDTVEGLDEARAAAVECGVRLIDGVEISAWFTREIHILGYFVDAADPVLRTVLTRRKVARVDRARAMGDRLAALGAPIDVDALLRRVEGNVGRPHVARALLEAGHVATFEEAFRRFLGRDGPAYVPAARLDAADAIRLIHAAGGVAVLAHPGVEGIDDAVPALVDLGLDGIEAVHPAHDEGQRRHYERLAARFGLVATGGTDFHSPESSQPPGTFGVAPAALEALERRSTHGAAAAS